MPGLGTLVNIISVLVCGLFGSFLGHKIPKKVHSILIKLVGLFAVYVGVDMFLKKERLAVVILAIIFGFAVGQALRLDRLFASLAERLQRLTKIKEATFLEGFITASLVFCIGPMAIVGPIAEGTSGEHKILYTKAVIDGITSIGLATSLGIGVVFSTLSLLIYQGGITLVAVFAGNMIPAHIINDLTSTGGILIGCVGINILSIMKRKIPVENLLPSIIFAVIFAYFYSLAI